MKCMKHLNVSFILMFLFCLRGSITVPRNHLSVLSGMNLTSFLSYNELEKQLNKIYKDENIYKFNGSEEEVVVIMEHEVHYFMELLDEELDKFNEFFLDKQEDCIIKMKVLQDRVAEVKGTPLELLELGRQIVEFQAEMVLLEDYSALSYTVLLKILKKYDKRSDALIREPYIQKVLYQPFFKTDILKHLVKECDKLVYQLISSMPLAAPSQCKDDPDNVFAGGPDEEKLHRVPEELEEIGSMENMYLRHTLSAIRVLNDIRYRSSTVSEYPSTPTPSEGVHGTLGDLPLLNKHWSG